MKHVAPVVLILDLGVLGVAVGLGSLLSGPRRKIVASLGIMASFVPLLLLLAFLLLGRLAGPSLNV